MSGETASELAPEGTEENTEIYEPKEETEENTEIYELKDESEEGTETYESEEETGTAANLESVQE